MYIVIFEHSYHNNMTVQVEIGYLNDACQSSPWRLRAITGDQIGEGQIGSEQHRSAAFYTCMEVMEVLKYAEIL